MSGEPRYSPWGQVDHCRQKADGVYSVSTSSHGGYMLTADAASKLTPAAVGANYYGGEYNGWTCFEEDAEWAIVDLEISEGRLGDEAKDLLLTQWSKWRPDGSPDTLQGLQDYLLRCLRHYYDGYLRARNLPGVPA